jgi:hypothetical protein
MSPNWSLTLHISSYFPLSSGLHKKRQREGMERKGQMSLLNWERPRSACTSNCFFDRLWSVTHSVATFRCTLCGELYGQGLQRNLWGFPLVPHRGNLATTLVPLPPYNAFNLWCTSLLTASRKPSLFWGKAGWKHEAPLHRVCSICKHILAIAHCGS